MRRKGRRIVILVVVIFMLLVFSLGAFAFQNEPEGFRGLKWGDTVGRIREISMEQMELYNKSDEWLSLYRNPGDKLKLGDAQFYMILYQFYTPSNAIVGRLLGTDLYFKDVENFHILKIICTTKFGKSFIRILDELYWISKATSVTLSYDLIKRKGFLRLRSVPLFEQYSEEKKKKQEEKEKKQAEDAEKDW